MRASSPAEEFKRMKSSIRQCTNS